jgi:hypothetical protein
MVLDQAGTNAPHNNILFGCSTWIRGSTFNSVHLRGSSSDQAGFIAGECLMGQSVRSDVRL